MEDDKNIVAAELALGLIDGREAREARHQLAIDPEMRDLHMFWTERLVGVISDTPEVPAPAGLFSRIEGALWQPAPQPAWRRWRAALAAPENRGLVLMVAGAKVALLAWILYLFL